METDVSKILTDLGEVKGLLRGVTDIIRHSNENMNKRIDDLSASLQRRLDVTDNRLSEIGEKADSAVTLATDTAARMSRHSIMFGGGAGGLISVGIELIKMMFTH